MYVISQRTIGGSKMTRRSAFSRRSMLRAAEPSLCLARRRHRLNVLRSGPSSGAPHRALSGSRLYRRGVFRSLPSGFRTIRSALRCRTGLAPPVM